MKWRRNSSLQKTNQNIEKSVGRKEGLSNQLANSVEAKIGLFILISYIRQPLLQRSAPSGDYDES